MKTIIRIVIFLLLVVGCTKEETVVEQEQLESTELRANKPVPFEIEGNDVALEQFIRDSFYSLPEYTNSWKGKRYALVIVQGGEQPYVNGEPMYKGPGNVWYIYSLQGGKQDRGDELVSDKLTLYEFKDLDKGEVWVLKNN